MSEGLNFSKDQLDVFREVGNIGAGNAATALASLLNRTIDMNVPNVKMVAFNEIPELVGGAENVVVGGLVNYTGDLSGFLILTIDVVKARKISSILCGEAAQEEPESPFFSEMELSALQEIVNILTGSYLSAISSFTDLNIVPSIPHLTVDMVGAILSIVAIEYGKIGDSAVFFETNFEDLSPEGENIGSPMGNMFLVPDYDAFQRLLSSLGVSS